MKTSDILKQFTIAVERTGGKIMQEIDWRKMNGRAETSTSQEVQIVMQSITKFITEKRLEAIKAEQASEAAPKRP